MFKMLTSSAKQKLELILMQDELFQGFTSSERQQLLHASKIMRHLPNRQILKGKQQLDYVYILLSGSLQVGWIQANGEMKTNDIIGHSMAFNLVALLQNTPINFDYFTLGNVELALICKDTFFKILQSNAQASWGMMQVLSKRMFNLFEQTRYLKTASLSQRIAIHLLKLNHQYGIKEGQSDLIQFRISQQEFSELFNVSRQTINKYLRHFLDDGLIEWHYSQIRILDRERLEQLSLLQ